MTREQLLQEALALPPEDRVFLADALEQSLNHGEFANREIADAWTAEIDRRIAAYDRGESAAVSVNEAMRSIRSRLDAVRASKMIHDTENRSNTQAKS